MAIPYAVSKVVIALLSPLGTTLVVGVAGLLLWRLRRVGAALVALALSWLSFWSLPAVSNALAQHVEAPYPPLRAEALPKAQAIVVLGGGMEPPSPGYPYANLNLAADRVWHAARVFKAAKAPLIVASGGGDPAVTPHSEARAMTGLLVDLGVPRAAILEEARSRNTHENAEFTARLLAPRKVHTILLVTSALHMRRAVAEFERAGFQVIPAATDHAQAKAAGLQDWLPAAEALDASGRAMKEMVGEWVTQWRGPAAARPVAASMPDGPGK
jgi:uncharacterized SAM-binding protein YcdF (DUF218 family)